MDKRQESADGVKDIKRGKFFSAEEIQYLSNKLIEVQGLGLAEQILNSVDILYTTTMASRGVLRAIASNVC